MKTIKRFAILVIIIFLFCTPAIGGTRVNDTVEGSEVVVFEFTTDGTWQAVTVPATMKNTRHVFLQVHDGVENSYTHEDVEFIVSSSSDGTSGFIWTNGITISVGKDRSEIICYIRAATGQTFSIMVLR